MKSEDQIISEFQNKLEAIPNKMDRVVEIISFVNIYGDNFGHKVHSFLEYGQELSKEINFEAGYIICELDKSFLTVMTSGRFAPELEKEMPLIEKMMTKLESDYPEWHSYGLCMYAYLYWYKGELDKGFSLMFESIKTKQSSIIHGHAWAFFGLGVFYFDTKDYDNSQIHYQRALDSFLQMDETYGIARASSGLASIAIVKGNLEDAKKILETSSNGYRGLSHKSGLSRALNDMGMLEKSQGNYDKALSILFESLELRKELNHVQGMITTYTEIGEIFFFQKNYEQAIQCFNNGIELSDKVFAYQKKMRLHKLLYGTYKALNNNELALKHFEHFFDIKSQILSDDAANNIKRLQTKYETEKSEKEAEFERLKNIELNKANEIIEQKNKDITDSINYARRIQLGILPSKETLDSAFPNYFVLYQPKDIVSGDFYWGLKSLDRKTGSELSIIAAIDCTGHGVPGAFMSMLGNTLLNQTIQNPEVVSAADVLNYLNCKLPENLKSVDHEQHIRDGMDMALAIFDFKNLSLQFAGANNPCWLIRDSEIIIYKGDKQAISASNDLAKHEFTNNNIELKKNDVVYLFTDGYADQFGGEKEKKFTYKRLRELLLKICTKNCEEQKQILIESFNSWKGNHEQIDDVCIIGIKI